MNTKPVFDWDLEDDHHRCDSPRCEAPETALDCAAPESGPPAARPPAESCVFPNFLPVASPTVIRIPPKLQRNLRILPLILAGTATRGGHLGVFGKGSSLPATVLMGPSKHATEDTYALSQITGLAMEHQQQGAGKPVRLLHHCPGGPNLNDEAGRRLLQDDMLPGSILIIYSLAGWCGNMPMNSETCDQIMRWLEGLCTLGHPVVVFEPTDLLCEGLSDRAEPENVVAIEFDPDAPYEHAGGGCVFSRISRGIFDEYPIRWNFWFRVQEGVLAWGMEVRDNIDADAMSEHERKVYLRRIDVAKGVKAGIEQKKLADNLKVSASTISRDVDALRKEGRLP